MGGEAACTTRRPSPSEAPAAAQCRSCGVGGSMIDDATHPLWGSTPPRCAGACRDSACPCLRLWAGHFLEDVASRAQAPVSRRRCGSAAQFFWGGRRGCPHASQPLVWEMCPSCGLGQCGLYAKHPCYTVAACVVLPVAE